MEISQVIQHFRSSQHLDGANVRPDNTIRLIARKPTGVRIYVDYDATAGLPPINQLTGQLEVRSSIGSLQSTLMPFSAIQPRRDDQIQRRDVTHTLNFLIPEDLCQGQLTISCRVFDVASPTKQSRLSERTLYFEEREPLRLFGVSVHYTGQSLDLAAPTQSDFINTVDFVEKVYPIPEAFMTGFTTIDFNEDMKADIKDGCGDGFNSLLDTLRDMRGDSTDVYYGLLPAGIDSGSVGGCGGGGVGAGFIGGGSTAAQEIGHAFGRDHAPCDSATRCGDPSDQDGEYPHYDGFPSDSIGEFGYDPENNVVFDPANTFDFMGYSGPNWVSPYTYEGMMGSFPSSSGITSGSAFSMLRAISRPPRLRKRDSEFQRTPMMTLFLGLTIHRNRKVDRRVSFHFASPQREEGCGKDTGFQVELYGEGDKVLSCQPLLCDCHHCRPDCWPKRLRKEVPFPAGARRLVVTEGAKVIYEEDIPDPPKLVLNYTLDSQKREVALQWTGGDQKQNDLWFLVQYRDHDGSWRGLSARTQQTHAVLPYRLWHGAEKLGVRVLASSGIATGIAQTEVSIAPAEPPKVDIVPVGMPGTAEGTIRLETPTIRIVLVTSSGRMISDADVRWFDDNGGSLGSGRHLPLAQLSEGQHTVRAVAYDHGYGVQTRRWTIERTEDGRWLLHASAETESNRDQRPNPHHPKPCNP